MHGSRGDGTYNPEPGHDSSRLWTLARAASFLLCLCMLGCAYAAPGVVLACFWGLLIPGLPLVLVIAPGVWRNVCPLATANQLSSARQWSRGTSPPHTMRVVAPLVSLGLLLSLVPLRRVLLDQNGHALGLFLVMVLCAAFSGGILFKGLSGWCGTICPLVQVERAYGQRPLLLVPSTRCSTCSGCVKNCYDATPRRAALNDFRDRRAVAYRARCLTAASLPWLTLSFFTVQDLQHWSLLAVLCIYGHVLGFVAIGCLLFVVLARLPRVDPRTLSLLHVALALNLFYAFVAPIIVRTLHLNHTPTVIFLRLGVGAVTLAWVIHSRPDANQKHRGAPERRAVDR